MREYQRLSFADYVSWEAIQLGGFNYWETSLLINTSNGLATVHIGRIENRHIAVVKDIRRSLERYRADWYFGLFDLPNSINCPPMEEIEKLVARKNRVAGRDLNEKILHAAEEIWDSE